METGKKIFITAALLLLFLPAFAQVQKGYVRTVGRPNNPKGTRIPGVVIRVAGLHSPVVSQSNGSFEIDLGGGQTSYTFTSVRDNTYQYELQEKELLNRNEPVSVSVPREIVMVSLTEKRAIEEKKRQQIENQYQKDIAKLEAQKAQNEITIEQYRQQLQQLQDAFDKRDMLITDLSEHFASIDYATLTEEQARISALLEDGDLLTADSIINAKGSIEERLGTFLDFKNENDKAAATLQQRRTDENASLEDLKKDCEAKFLIYKQQHKNDSAAYYLELIVALDTTDVDNLLRAGSFIAEYLAQFSKAQTYFERALHNAQAQYGSSHPKVAACDNQIGSLYEKTDNYALSLEYHEKALNTYKSLLGENSVEVAACYNNLGTVYNEKGHYDQALEYLQKSLEIDIKELGENTPDVAECYGNMGTIYSHQSQYDKALEYHEKALEISKKLFGENHQSVAKCYNGIGNVYCNQKNFDKALVYLEKALEIRKTIFNETHPDVAGSYNNVASVLFRHRKYDQALEMFQTALEITKKVYGRTHQNVAMCYNNIGSIYATTGDYDKALEAFQNSLEITQNVLGENHPRVALIYNNIGFLYEKKGDYVKALERFSKSLEISSSGEGANNTNVAQTYANMSNVYLKQGRYDEALATGQKALEIRVSTLIPNHPYIADSYRMLGDIYASQNDILSALENYLYAHDILCDNFGKTDARAQKIAEKIDATYKNTKNSSQKVQKQAEKLYQQWVKETNNRL